MFQYRFVQVLVLIRYKYGMKYGQGPYCTSTGTQVSLCPTVSQSAVQYIHNCADALCQCISTQVWFWPWGGTASRGDGVLSLDHLIDRVRQPVVHISTSSLPVRSCERSGFLSEERTFKFLQVREYTWNCLCAKQQFACNPAVICFCVNCTILVLHFGEDKFTHSSVFVFLQWFF